MKSFNVAILAAAASALLCSPITPAVAKEKKMQFQEPGRYLIICNITSAASCQNSRTDDNAADIKGRPTGYRQHKPLSGVLGNDLLSNDSVFSRQGPAATGPTPLGPRGSAIAR